MQCSKLKDIAPHVLEGDSCVSIMVALSVEKDKIIEIEKRQSWSSDRGEEIDTSNPSRAFRLVEQEMSYAHPRGFVAVSHAA
eukprot:5061226-Amphidinium_carterae.1